MLCSVPCIARALRLVHMDRARHCELLLSMAAFYAWVMYANLNALLPDSAAQTTQFVVLATVGLLLDTAVTLGAMAVQLTLPLLLGNGFLYYLYDWGVAWSTIYDNMHTVAHWRKREPLLLGDAPLITDALTVWCGWQLVTCGLVWLWRCLQWANGAMAHFMQRPKKRHFRTE